MDLESIAKARPVFNDVMWKRLDKPTKENVAAIIVDQSGMDFYTNESGLFVLQCIEKGLIVSDILDLIKEIGKNSKPEKIENLIKDAVKFIQLLSDNKIIRFENL